MNKALAFAKLDFLTVKTYFTPKNLALMIGAPLVMIFAIGISSITASSFVLLSALYVSYPFIICEKNDMDALYVTLSIPRGSIVLGRFIYTFLFSMCMGIIGLLFMAAATMITGTTISISETLFIMLALFAVISGIESYQIAVFFKLGYEKAKAIANLPYFILWPAIMIFGKFIPDDFGLPKLLASDPGLIVIAAAVVWICIIAISYRASLSFYRRREF